MRPHPSASAPRLRLTVQLSGTSSLPQVKHPVMMWCCMTRLARASLRTFLLLCPSSLLLKRMWQRRILVRWIFNTPPPFLWVIHGPPADLLHTSLLSTCHGPTQWRSMESSWWSNNFIFSQRASGRETSRSSRHLRDDVGWKSGDGYLLSSTPPKYHPLP